MWAIVLVNEDDEEKEVWECKKTFLALERSAILSLDFSPNGEMLAICGEWVNVHVVANDFSLLHTLRTRKVNIFAFSPDSTRIFTCEGLGVISLWNSTEGTLLKTRNNKSVKSVAYSPNGKLIACVHMDNTLIILDAQTLRWKFTICDDRTMDLNYVKFSRTGPYLLAVTGYCVHFIKITLLERENYKRLILGAFIRFQTKINQSAFAEEVDKFTETRQSINNGNFGNATAGKFLTCALVG